MNVFRGLRWRRLAQHVAVACCAPIMAFAAWASVSPAGLGQDAALRVSGLTADEQVTVDLIRPDGTVISFAEDADSLGVVESTLYGLHLKQSGTYTAGVFRTLGESPQTDFTIAGAPASAYASEATAQPSSAPADGQTPVRVQIVAQDAFGNRLPDARVQVVSSRNSDQINAPPTTNNQGVMTAQVTSSAPGVSVLSVLIDGVVLRAKPEIVWYASATVYPNAGAPDSPSLGSFLRAQLFDDNALASPDVSRLRVEGRPNTIEGEAMTVTVTAVDTNGNTVNNYEGRVRFDSSDVSAQLPADYTFTAVDQGVHEFSLAVTMNTIGPHEVTVGDLDDFRIQGDLQVQVESANGSTSVGTSTSTSTSAGSSGSRAVRIITPIEGTYKTKRPIIKGTSANCPQVRLTKNDEVMIAALNTNADGTFQYQTEPLDDGLWALQAICEQDQDVISNVVQIRIDRQAPVNMAVTLQPGFELCPGDAFTVALGATEPLAAARCIFRDIPNDHAPAGDEFVGNYTAPLDFGSYSMDCSIFDLTGNQLDQPSAATIVVKDCENVIGPVDGNTETGTDDTTNGGDPSDPFGPEGDADNDGVRNKDEWKDDNNNDIPDVIENPTHTPRDVDLDGIPDDDEPVWGTNPLDADTDAGGIWDGVEVYFLQTDPLSKDSPTAEQDRALEPENVLRRAIVGLPAPGFTPGMTDAQIEALTPAQKGDLNNDGTPDWLDKSNDADGDGVPDFLEPGAEKLNADNDTDGDGLPNNMDPFPLRPSVERPFVPAGQEDPTPVGNLSLSPYTGDETRVWLSWSPAVSNAGIDHYEIAFGADIRALTNTNTTPDARTRWYVENLVACDPLTFRVTAVNRNGELSAVEYIEGVAGENCDVTPIGPIDVDTPLAQTGNSRLPAATLPTLLGLVTGVGIYFLMVNARRKDEELA